MLRVGSLPENESGREKGNERERGKEIVKESGSGNVKEMQQLAQDGKVRLCRQSQQSEVVKGAAILAFTLIVIVIATAKAEKLPVIPATAVIVVAICAVRQGIFQGIGAA